VFALVKTRNQLYVLTLLSAQSLSDSNFPEAAFLPFATDAKGQTLYEKMVEGKF